MVTLESGSVELAVSIYRGGIGAGTEPAVFSRASGSFRGVSFDQRDYFKLVYSPQHHHFGRHYVATALFEVAGLFDPQALVELVGTAVIPEEEP